MHERSLVKSLLQQAIEAAGQSPQRRIAEICLRVGPLSGVEPLLLKSAFDELSPEAIGPGAALAIEEVDLLARCRRCRQEFVLPDFRFRCLHCGATDLTIIEGDGIVLQSVSVAEVSVLAPGANA